MCRGPVYQALPNSDTQPVILYGLCRETLHIPAYCQMRGFGKAETEFMGAVKHKAKIRKDEYIQFLRGCAMIAVVLIHCLPQADWILFLRPFLNCAVAMFLFLSGLLTPVDKCIDISSFYKRRIGKILIPYVFWSCVYLIVARQTNPFAIIKSLCLGTSAAQMYFLLVYAQMVLLTPLLYKVLNSKYGWLLWLVTPVTLVVREIAVWRGTEMMAVSFAFFGSWLIYYILGLRWRTIAKHFNHLGLTACAVIVTLVLQMASALYWNKVGCFSLASTQIKVTAMISTLAIIIFSMQIPALVRKEVSQCRLIVLIGDCSYGVYLCHMLFLVCIRKACESAGMSVANVWGALLLWILTLAVSTAVVWICQRVLPTSLQRILGFE